MFARRWNDYPSVEYTPLGGVEASAGSTDWQPVTGEPWPAHCVRLTWRPSKDPVNSWHLWFLPSPELAAPALLKRSAEDGAGWLVERSHSLNGRPGVRWPREADVDAGGDSDLSPED